MTRLLDERGRNERPAVEAGYHGSRRTGKARIVALATAQPFFNRS